MKESEVCVSSGVVWEDGEIYIETRAQVIGSPDGSLPEGKVFVFRTPIPPPGVSEDVIRASTTVELADA